jgi:S-adenosylmethionine synthetase
MKKAIIRINELQQEMSAKALQVEGAADYIQEQMERFGQEEALRKQDKIIQNDKDLKENFNDKS